MYTIFVHVIADNYRRNSHMIIHRKSFRGLAVMLALIVAVSMAPIGGAYAYADEVTDGTAVTTGTDGTAGTDPATGTDATTGDEEGDSLADLDMEADTGTDGGEANIEDPTVIEVPDRTDIAYTGEWPSLPGGAQAIAQTAINLAWPYGTAKSKYSYHGGSATPAFQLALNTVYPNRSGWGPKPKVGASCDVFTETCVRYSGYDTSVPRGYTDAEKYYKKHTEKWTKTNVCKVKDMQSGDVILWRKSSGTVHACIFVRINGTGYLAEAHYVAEEYGCIDKKARDYTPSKYAFFGVFRANSSYQGSLDKGYTGDNVKRLQKFLNWAGFDCGTVDGSFGNKTDAAVKAFQTAAGIKVDGRFGKASLAAAKAFVPSKPAVVHQTPAKKGYTGSFPNVGKKGLKYKKKAKKNAEVKKMQKFLNWYGGYKLKTDGKFGKKTRTAVKKFQKKEKLKVDGIFGKASLKRAKAIRK